MAGSTEEMIRPGQGRGLLDVYDHRFLLKLLVLKISVNYKQLHKIMLLVVKQINYHI